MNAGAVVTGGDGTGDKAAPAVAMEKHLTVDTGDAACALFLELAAGDDADGVRHAPPGAADEVGLWYGRSKGSARMVLEHRTPLMVASTYGSLAVIRLHLSRRCGPDAATALHCAASGGSQYAVRLLLAVGVDADAKDDAGCRPADVAAAHIAVNSELRPTSFSRKGRPVSVSCLVGGPYSRNSF